MCSKSVQYSLPLCLKYQTVFSQKKKNVYQGGEKGAHSLGRAFICEGGCTRSSIVWHLTDRSKCSFVLFRCQTEAHLTSIHGKLFIHHNNIKNTMIMIQLLLFKIMVCIQKGSNYQSVIIKTRGIDLNINSGQAAITIDEIRAVHGSCYICQIICISAHSFL